MLYERSTNRCREGVFAGGHAGSSAVQLSAVPEREVLFKSIACAISSKVVQHEGGGPPVFFPRPELP